MTFPTETVAVVAAAEFRPVCRTSYRAWAHGTDGIGSRRSSSSGMTVGTPNSGQVNALGTLNLRGERSVTCKGDRDRARSAGPLPPGSPAVCEEFRAQPDALERAAELDAQFGARPDLTRLPLYCIPFSFKDPYDTKDMRTTAAADARTTSTSLPGITLVAQLRDKGAIIYAKAVNTEYNGIPAAPPGRNEPDRILVSDLDISEAAGAAT